MLGLRYLLGICLLLMAFAGHMAMAAQDKTPPSALSDETGTSGDTTQSTLHLMQVAPLPKTWPSLVITAGSYARYLEIVQEAKNTPPTSADDLEHLMRDIASFDGAKLSRGFHAHAVLQAMQTPAFYTGVQKWGRLYDRKQIMANLRMNPAYVEQMPGYIQARGHVLHGIEDQGKAVMQAGGVYKDLAYTLQKKKWALRVRGGKALRLASLRNAHLEGIGIPGPLLQSLMRAYAPPPAITPMMNTATTMPATLAALRPENYTLQKLPHDNAARAVSYPTVKPMIFVNPARAGELQDILARAALQILDHNTPYPSALPPRNTPDTLAECVDWARMHLNQCVAATRFIYEDSFCIAKHQLGDSGRCIAAFLGGAPVATH